MGDPTPHGTGPEVELPWHALQTAEVEAALKTGRLGLSEVEAAHRLLRSGPNSLPEPRRPGPLALLAHQFANPLICICSLRGPYVSPPVIPRTPW